jgi:hypothetical protein
VSIKLSLFIPFPFSSCTEFEAAWIQHFMQQCKMAEETWFDMEIKRNKLRAKEKLIGTKT